jgi:hypothetical protein
MKSIQSKYFGAAPILIGQSIFSVIDIINGIEELPTIPIDQKEWLELAFEIAAAVERKFAGVEPFEAEWSIDSEWMN